MKFLGQKWWALQLVLLGAAMLLGALFFGGSSSCTAAKAREAVLTPAVQTAWVSISKDVARGVEDARSDGDLSEGDEARVARFGAEITSGLVTRGQWPLVEPFALRGIQDAVDDGDIGVGVAGSLRERLHNFGAAIAALGG